MGTPAWTLVPERIRPKRPLAAPALQPIGGPASGPLLIRRARERSLGLAAALILLLAAFAGDYLTGEQVSFSICYMAAIGIAAWFSSRTAGLALAGLSTVAWVTSYLLVGYAFSQPSILYWNIAVEAGIYVGTALAIARVRDDVAREQALNAQVTRAYEGLSREAESAGLLQLELLSKRPVEIPGYESRVHYATSTRAGGDLYDYIPLPDGRVGIVVADASGHGVSAAVLMGMTLVLMRSASARLMEPDEVLARVNDHLFRALPAGSFVTASYLVLDPASGQIAYSLAGHDPPLIKRASTDDVERLSLVGGAPLGLMAVFSEERASSTLNPGDTLLLYTDGIPEAMNSAGETFGEERLLEMLAHSDGTIDELLSGVLFRVNLHTEGAPLRDDLTLLVLQRSVASKRESDSGGGVTTVPARAPQ